jgi:hypothetical protein
MCSANNIGAFTQRPLFRPRLSPTNLKSCMELIIVGYGGDRARTSEAKD